MNQARKMPKFNKIINGWGLAAQQQTDGTYLLWASDSSPVMKAFDPEKWEHNRKLRITYEDGSSVKLINELEIIPESEKLPSGISNYCFANAFYSNRIFMIDLRTGIVAKWWNVQLLIDHQNDFIKNAKKELEKTTTDEQKQIFGKNQRAR